ncbi:putative ribonuclease H-like domain-containing protein [Tanacetum coccineum]
MDLETAQTNTTAKLPLLKQGEYDMWKLRIEQYFQVQDYALWDVIENGNSFKPAAQTTTNAEGTSTTLIPGLVTTDEKTQKKNDVKARIWRNKPDLDTMSFDDLYNNFKIVKQEVKGTASSSSSSSSQNLNFVSSTSSTNEVNTAYGVSTANLSDDTVYAFLANQPNRSHLVQEDLEQIHEDYLEEMDLKSDTAGYDKSKVECFNCHKLGHFARECRGPKNQDNRSRNQDSSRRTINMEEISSKAMMAIDGTGFDWSFMVDEEVPSDMALMAFSDSKFNKSEFNLATYKRGLASIEEQLVFYKKNEVLFWSQIPDKSRKGLGFVSYNVVPPPPIGLFSPLTINFSNSSLEEFQQPEFEGYGPKISKSVSEDISNEVMKSLDAPLVKELVLNDKLEKKTVLLTVAKINFVKSQQQEKPVTYAEMLTAITIKRKGWYLGHPQIEDQGYVESGCSRHMTCNMSYLLDFKEFDRGYVTFGGGATGGRITGKGTLKTGKLDFEDVYFVKELQFNLFSVSQMCDKKNNVLFTDTGCFVLSLDFKLADESQVLLKVPRKNNMYSVDMKNIVPKESLTFAKKVKVIRCDNGTEFKNRVISEFCEKKGIKREYSVARTPQQNGVAERRNRTLIEEARTMLADSKLPTTFWAEAVNTACYVQNRVLVVKPHTKTPYELVRGRTPALSFIRPFGCHVTILNTLDHLVKFDGKSDAGFFVGYILNSKAFRVYNIRTRKVEEILHIKFLEDKPIIAGDGPKWLFDIDVLTQSMNYVPVVAGSSQDYIVMPLWKDDPLFDSSLKNASDAEPQPFSDIEKKDDEGVSKDSGLDDQERPANNTQDDNDSAPSINTASTNVNTGSSNINTVNLKVATAPIEATYDDLSGYETEVDVRNITTTYSVSSNLNTRIYKDHSLAQVIGDIKYGVLTRGMTKTTNDQGFISAVYEGKTHEDFILSGLLVSYLGRNQTMQSSNDSAWVECNADDVLSSTVYMDVKSAFLYGKIEEEVYVCQPLGFEDPNNLNKVYKVVKALYGLHQAPRAWYETLAKYLLDNGFHRGKIDQTLFIKKQKGDILLVQENSLFLRYLKGQPKLGLWYPRDSPFDLVAYSESDYAGASLDRKSTIGGCQFLGCRLISWQCKKQTVVATSFNEAKYVAVASCCGQNGFRDNLTRVNAKFTPELGSLLNLFLEINIMSVSELKRIERYKQFWQTATASTLENGDMEITATIDGKVKVVSEASIKRHLKLEDSDGISDLPTTEIFKQLALMGYLKELPWDLLGWTLERDNKKRTIKQKPK